MKTTKPTRLQDAARFNQFIERVILSTTISAITKDNFRYGSLRAIQDDYGNSCARLFSLVFTQWQRGGRTLDGKPYKSIWRIDVERLKLLKRALEATESNELRTARDVLKLMGNILPQKRVKVYSEDFSSFEAEVFSGKDLEEVMSLKRALRKDYAEERQLRGSLM